MSNRQQIINNQQNQQELYVKRAEEYSQKFKGPVLSHQAAGNQIIPNVIDSLIKQCLELHQYIDTLTSEKQKVDEELATLKAVNSSKEDKTPKQLKNRHNI